MANGGDKNLNVTLNQFIEENYRLLSTLGVLVALTIFSASIELKELSPILSFIFLSAAVFVLIELLGRFPRKQTGLLMGFEFSLVAAMFSISVYWYYRARRLWGFFLVLPLFVLFLYLSAEVVKRLNLHERVSHLIPEKRKWVRKIARGTIILVQVAGSLALAILLTPYATRFADRALLSPPWRESLPISPSSTTPANGNGPFR